MQTSPEQLRKMLKVKTREEVRKELGLSIYLFNKLLIEKKLVGKKFRQSKFNTITDEEFANMYMNFSAKTISLEYKISKPTIFTRAKRLGLRKRGIKKWPIYLSI